MTVTFSVRGLDVDWDDPSTFVNVSNVNARALLEWLGLEPGEFLHGSVSSSELAALCRRRLWGNVARNEDPGTPGHEDRRPMRCPVFYAGRPPGYLRLRTEQLLLLAQRRPDGTIDFG